VEAATDLILTYRYVFVFALAAFDGPLASFVVGFFVASGHLDFTATYFSLLSGDVMTCIIVYSLGHYGSRLQVVQRLLGKAAINGHVAVLRTIWHRHPTKTMFLSKLAYGLSTPFLIAAGVVDLPWRKFLVLVSLVAAFQYGVLLTLAASLGNYLGTATDIFWWMKVVIAIVVLVVLGYLFIGRRVRDMLLREEREIDEQQSAE
jgi:membrane protein DedA with SNARE-associated domain